MDTSYFCLYVLLTFPKCLIKTFNHVSQTIDSPTFQHSATSHRTTHHPSSPADNPTFSAPLALSYATLTNAWVLNNAQQKVRISEQGKKFQEGSKGALRSTFFSIPDTKAARVCRGNWIKEERKLTNKK